MIVKHLETLGNIVQQCETKRVYTEVYTIDIAFMVMNIYTLSIRSSVNVLHGSDRTAVAALFFSVTRDGFRLTICVRM